MVNQTMMSEVPINFTFCVWVRYEKESVFLLFARTPRDARVRERVTRRGNSQKKLQTTQVVRARRYPVGASDS